MSGKSIRIRGAREHNLKGISLEIPRDKLVVITGLSGSGKSSLAFDTIYAEGQRKYVESLSAYARQFLEQLKKPDVEEIEGLPPTIAIEQRSSSSNPRSIVATTTEIYDYLRVLFARVGTPHCWECGRPISSQSVSQIVDRIMAGPEGQRVMVLAPLIRDQKGEHREVLADIRRQGFARARVDGQIVELSSPDRLPPLAKTFKHSIEAVIDRLILKPDIRSRLADSVELAAKLSKGLVLIASQQEAGPWTDQVFSERFACPDHPQVSLAELEPRIFSFNSPHGACPTCHGLGAELKFDPDLVISDPQLSLQDGAVEAWRGHGKRMTIWYSRQLRRFCQSRGLDYSTPFCDFTKIRQKELLYGAGDFDGVIPDLERRFHNTESEFVKNRLSQYLTEQPCAACGGKRLRPESLAVTIVQDESRPKANLNLHDIISLSIDKAHDYFQGLVLGKEAKTISEPILREIISRLTFMRDVGLGYLTIDRKTATLSGGEAQRIRLATQVGSGLVGVCYVLDEPTIGLHQRDNRRLIRTLRRLTDLGNTVIMVEHDEDCIRAADWLIDIGPGAGSHGGEIMAQGPMPQVLENAASLTVRYLTGDRAIPVPRKRRPMHPGKFALEIKGCRENNLKDVDVKFPLGGIVCVTGVSGSGKSTLVNQTLLPALKRKIMGTRVKPGEFRQLLGTAKINKVIEIDQSAIGRTPRSNPATYTGVFDEIRKVMAMTKDAKLRGYKPGRFSFNVKGGRCEACQGQGTKCIEMHFLPDVYVQCEACEGTRYNTETLQIRYKGKTIADILAMTIEEAVIFFGNFPRIRQMLSCLADVGLTYVQLGQPSTQLSGGEAQRVKLSTELGKTATGDTLYVLDEPTTGLHFADIQNLLGVLNRLADMGNTVIVIEHNLDIIKSADWIIDLGPEGGNAGGTIVAQGTPEQVAKCPDSFTGQYLAPLLNTSGAA